SSAERMRTQLRRSGRACVSSRTSSLRSAGKSSSPRKRDSFSRSATISGGSGAGSTRGRPQRAGASGASAMHANATFAAVGTPNRGGGRGGQAVGEVLHVLDVDLAVVGGILDEQRHLHHALEGGPGRGEDGRHVLEGPARLPGGRAFARLPADVVARPRA